MSNYFPDENRFSALFFCVPFWPIVVRPWSAYYQQIQKSSRPFSHGILYFVTMFVSIPSPCRINISAVNTHANETIILWHIIDCGFGPIVILGSTSVIVSCSRIFGCSQATTTGPLRWCGMFQLSTGRHPDSSTIVKYTMAPRLFYYMQLCIYTGRHPDCSTIHLCMKGGTRDSCSRGFGKRVVVINIDGWAYEPMPCVVVVVVVVVFVYISV